MWAWYEMTEITFWKSQFENGNILHHEDILVDNYDVKYIGDLIRQSVVSLPSVVLHLFVPRSLPDKNYSTRQTQYIKQTSVTRGAKAFDTFSELTWHNEQMCFA